LGLKGPFFLYDNTYYKTMEIKMKIEITELKVEQAMDRSTFYRYDFYLDDVFITFGNWGVKQDAFSVYDYFIKLVIREWQTKYRSKYNMNKITKQDMARFNPVTIVKEDIQDIDLTLKRASEFIRLQKIEEDF